MMSASKPIRVKPIRQFQQYISELRRRVAQGDVSAMCDVRLRSWIKQNNIELVNYRDALYGSDEYQNHLKATGSDLVMI